MSQRLILNSHHLEVLNALLPPTCVVKRCGTHGVLLRGPVPPTDLAFAVLRLVNDSNAAEAGYPNVDSSYLSDWLARVASQRAGHGPVRDARRQRRSDVPWEARSPYETHPGIALAVDLSPPWEADSQDAGGARVDTEPEARRGGGDRYEYRRTTTRRAFGATWRGGTRSATPEVERASDAPLDDVSYAFWRDACITRASDAEDPVDKEQDGKE